MAHLRKGSLVAAAIASGVTMALAGPSAGAPGSTPPTAKGPLVSIRAPHTSLHPTQSNNWSGYNKPSFYNNAFHPYTSIRGTWIVPRATQHKAGEAEYSATWVGIGGGCVDVNCTVTDQTLIQAGTEQDVGPGGRATYGTWYELIPNTSTSVNLPVRPGDSVTVVINRLNPATWSISIRNNTTGKSWSKNVQYLSSGGSAEWIEETPLVLGGGGTGVAALPNLGKVRFTNAAANGKNAALVPADKMQLVGSNNQVLATPSDPHASGTAFNDCTFAATCS